jgi:hypothetical protein
MSQSSDAATPEAVSKPARSVAPGQPVRFVVIAPDGARSSTWRVWTSRNKLDAYITCRAVARDWKVSLHESGRWQHGFTSLERARKLHPTVQTRHVDTWVQPAEMVPGLRRAFTLVVPNTELRLFAPQEPTDVLRVPAAGPEHAAVIEFAFFDANPPLKVTFQEPIFDIASLERTDGNGLRVIARQVPWIERDQEWLAKLKLAAADGLGVPEVVRVRVAGSLRLMLMGHQNEDGTRFVIDASADPPTV